MNKVLSTGKEVMKAVAAIGNGVLSGLVAGLSFLPFGMPVRICACVSSFVLGGILTDKTDAYIDKCADQIQEEINKAADELDEDDKELQTEAFEE